MPGILTVFNSNGNPIEIPAVKGKDGLTTSVNNIAQVNGNIRLTQDDIPDGESRKLLRLIRSVTLSSAAASITISQDESSQSFSLRSADIRIDCPAFAADDHMLLQLNDISDSYYYCFEWNPDAPVEFARVSYAYSLYSTARIICEAINGNAQILANTVGVQTGPIIRDNVFFTLLKPGAAISSITKIKLYCADSSNFPAGTKIQIEGVDA